MMTHLTEGQPILTFIFGNQCVKNNSEIKLVKRCTLYSAFYDIGFKNLQVKLKRSKQFIMELRSWIKNFEMIHRWQKKFCLHKPLDFFSLSWESYFSVFCQYNNICLCFCNNLLTKCRLAKFVQIEPCPFFYNC